MGQEQQKAQMVIEEIKKVVTGKDECIEKAFAAILAGGHILIEDVPGVGKTTLALAFSKAMALVNYRVQFTPDVMPADILDTLLDKGGSTVIDLQQVDYNRPIYKGDGREYYGNGKTI